MSEQKMYWWKCTCLGPYAKVNVRRPLDGDITCSHCGREMEPDIEGSVAELIPSCKARKIEEIKAARQALLDGADKGIDFFKKAGRTGHI